ncbi:hypothetical protein V2J09_018236 [Rumex salicifolius]
MRLPNLAWPRIKQFYLRVE